MKSLKSAGNSLEEEALLASPPPPLPPLPPLPPPLALPALAPPVTAGAASITRPVRAERVFALNAAAAEVCGTTTGGLQTSRRVRKG